MARPAAAPARHRGRAARRAASSSLHQDAHATRRSASRRARHLSLCRARSARRVPVDGPPLVEHGHGRGAAGARLRRRQRRRRRAPGPVVARGSSRRHARAVPGLGRQRLCRPSRSTSSLRAALHHVDTFWQQRDRDRVALFHYADLEVDLIGEMQRLARVLEIDISAERVQELAGAAGLRGDEGTFPRPRRPTPRSGVTPDAFFHQGGSGQWRAVLTDGERRALRRPGARARPARAGGLGASRPRVRK